MMKIYRTCQEFSTCELSRGKTMSKTSKIRLFSDLWLDYFWQEGNPQLLNLTSAKINKKRAYFAVISEGLQGGNFP